MKRIGTLRPHAWLATWAQRQLWMAVLLLSVGCVPAVQAATFVASNVAELIEAINVANSHADADTIELIPWATYTLTDVADVPNGAGLPSISSDIIIKGNGAIITRASNTLPFRIFHVAAISTLTLEDLSISNGLADYGAGLFIAGDLVGGGLVTLTRCTVYGNMAEVDGGGIFNYDGALWLTDSTVSGNTAQGNGGAFFNYDGGIVLINSTVHHNMAQAGGGAFSNDNGGVILANSTISGNVAAGNGGAFSNRASGIVLIHSTITGNTATAGGGIFSDPSDTASSSTELFHTIVANNPSGHDCAGKAVSSGGFNLDSDGTCLASPATGDLPGTDPLLDPELKDNGGRTMTHALLTGSPAKDAVNVAACLDSLFTFAVFDQRGVLRPQDSACDMGAFEVQGASNAHTVCSVLGNNTSGLDTDVFQFTATAGQPAGVILQSQPGGAYPEGQASLVLQSLVPGASFFQRDFGFLPNDLSGILPGTGKYQVIVAQQASSTGAKRFRGPYCLTLVRLGGGALQPTSTVE